MSREDVLSRITVDPRDLDSLPDMSPFDGREVPPIRVRDLRMPRITTGRLMIAIAIVAALTGPEIERYGARFEERRSRCLAWAEYCAGRELVFRHHEQKALMCLRGEHPDGRPTCVSCDVRLSWRNPPALVASRCGGQAIACAQAKERYRRAIWRTWEPVPDDWPPRPPRR